MMISPETLRRFPLFGGLEFKSIQVLAMASKEVTIPQGEWLFHEREEADAIYVILSGKVDLRMAINSEGAHTAVIDHLVEGDPLGWSALVEPFTYTASALVTEDARLVRLSAEDIRNLMEEYPSVGYRLMDRLSRIIRDRLVNIRTRFVSLTEPGSADVMAPVN